MSEIQSVDFFQEPKFEYGEHFFIRPKGGRNWTVTYVENVDKGRPVLAMPEAYAQAMLIQTEHFECYTSSNGRYQLFNASLERIRFEKPAYVILSKLCNVTVTTDSRLKKRLIVNFLSTIQTAETGRQLYAIVENISSSGCALTCKGHISGGASLELTFHMPVRNFFKNIIKAKGSIIWACEKDGCTSMGVALDNNAVENTRLLEYFYNYHLKT